MLVLLMTGSLALPLVGAAQSSGEAAEPDETLAQIDSLREAGAFEDAYSQLRTLRDRHGDEVGLLWRMSLTQVDLANTTAGRKAVEERYQKALTLADAALSADTMSAHAHLAKAVAEARIALNAGTKERVERSRAVKAHADRAIEIDSTLDGAYHTRARWYREVADLGFLERTFVKAVYGGLPEASFEQAVADFKRAIELHPERFHHLELAKTYLKMGREEDARAELMTVVDLPPTDPFAEKYGNQAREMLNDFE
jgi:tetratricopeptide (TPR) repeat protein